MATRKESRTGMGRPGTSHVPINEEIVQVTMTVPVTARLLSMKPNELSNLWTSIGEDAGVDINVGKSKTGYQIVLRGSQKNIIKAKGMITRRTQPQDTVRVTVAKQYHGYIIAKGRLQAIRDETEARIILPQQDDPSDVITISGTPAAIESAKQKVLDLAMEGADYTTETLEVSHDYQNFLRKSAQQMENESHARISFPAPNSETPDVVHVSGKSSSVAKAKTDLKAAYDKLKSTMFQIDVKIPKNTHGYLIGQGGSVIKSIRETTNTLIKMPDRDDPSESVTVLGDPENVMKAVQLIREKSHVIHERVTIPAHYHKFIAGSDRSNLRNLQTNHGVRITLPKYSDKSPEALPADCFDIEGTEAAVQNAKQEILALASKIEERVIDVPESYRSYIIGQKGQRITKLTESTGVDVVFPPGDDAETKDKVAVIGSPDNVEKGIEEIRKLMIEKDHLPVKMLCTEPAGAIVRYLVKAVSKELSSIGEKTNVDISLSRNETQFVLYGVVEDNEKAQNLLLELAAKVVKKTINVPAIYHGYIIGTNGNTIKGIRNDTHCDIELPGRDVKSDAIIIYAMKEEDVDNAIAMITQVANERSKITMSTSFTLPTRVCLLMKSSPTYLAELMMSTKTSISMEPAGFGFHNDVYTYVTDVIVKGLPEDTLALQTRMTAYVDALVEKRIVLNDEHANKVTGSVMPGLDNSDGNIKSAVLKFIENHEKVQLVDADETGVLLPVRDAGKRFNVSISIEAVVKGKSVNFSVVLSGNDSDSVRKANTVLDTMMTTTALVPERVVVHIPEVFVPYVEYIVTAGGALAKYPNVRVIFPSKGADKDTLVLSGPKQEVDQAGEVLESLSEAIVEESVSVPKDVRLNFKKIQEDCNVWIKNMDYGILVVGLVDDVAAAVSAVDDTVARSFDHKPRSSGKPQFTSYVPQGIKPESSQPEKKREKSAKKPADHLDIPADKFDLLVAKQKEIESKFSVTLNLPRAKKDNMFVAVKGNGAAPANAITFMKELFA